MINENKLQDQEEILKQQEAEVIEGGANEIDTPETPEEGDSEGLGVGCDCGCL